MMKSVIIQIPEIKLGFLSEVFETATQNNNVSVERKCRITQFFADLKTQITENDKLIYTSFRKSDFIKLLKDLQLHYRNMGQTALFTRVDSLIKELQA